MGEIRENIEIFRPRTSYIIFGLAVFFAIGLIAATATTSTATATIALTLWSLAGCQLVYFVYLRPKIIIFDHGIEIVNPFFNEVVGWHEVESIDAKFTLLVTTTDRTIHASAAPTTGRYHTRKLLPGETRGLGFSGGTSIRSSHSPRSDSGAATQILTVRQQGFLADGRESIVARSRTFHRKGVLTLCATILIAIIATIIA